jgi:hypothetical protein
LSYFHVVESRRDRSSTKGYWASKPRLLLAPNAQQVMLPQSLGGDEQGCPRMDGMYEHDRKPARRIAPMRDLMPIVALIAALTAMFWLQG